MLAVTGFRTSIVRSLAQLIDEPIVRIGADLSKFDCPVDVPPADRFVLAAGVLHQKTIGQQSPAEITESLAVNVVNVVRMCEHILSTNDNARIVIIGSESGSKGSYDQTYALAKAGVHAYVRWRKVLPTQQLVALAAPIISDSGMTMRRHDYPEVLARRPTITAEQVARCVKSLLYSSPPGANGVAHVC